MAKNTKQHAANLEHYTATLLSSMLEAIPVEAESSFVMVSVLGGLLLLLAVA